MDPAHYAIQTPPIRLEPWIRNYNEASGRDDRQAHHRRIVKERERREFMSTAAAINSSVPVKQTPYTPTLSSINAMPRFAVPPRGPLDPSYSSVRANGELPIAMSMRERVDNSRESALNSARKAGSLLIDQSDHPHPDGRP